MKTKKGFTLVELIVVIVIIGILALISVIGYSNQALRARNNSVFSSLSETVKAINVCVANGDNVNAYVSGGPICAGTSAVSGVWPNLTGIGGGWAYTGTPTYTAISNTLSIVAGSNSGGAFSVNCNISGCTKSGF